MSRLAKGLVALCFLLVAGATVGIEPATAGLLGPLGPKTAPPEQTPPPTQPKPTSPPPASSTSAPKTTKATPKATAAPKLVRGPQTPPNSTGALLAALAPLADRGLPMPEIARMGFGQFPVGGAAQFRDTWMAARENPRPHWHKGTDIFAPAGTVVRAPTAGKLELKRGGAGGLAAFLKSSDGNEFYFAHFAAFGSFPTGANVNAGDVIGYVGTTGNAEGDSPHTHFEIHLKGKGPVNPKPILDAWLTDALTNAPNVVAPFLAVVQSAPPMSRDDQIKAVLRPLTPVALLDVLELR